MRVVLVRHAKSAPDPERPSSEWDLSEEGRRVARALRLEGVTRLLAGPEPRMASTLVHLGPVEVDDRLRESDTTGWLDDPEAFLDAVRRFHAGDPLPGWEPAVAVSSASRRASTTGSRSRLVAERSAPSSRR
jgi:broad specificity phosphatase PhoE